MVRRRGLLPLLKILPESLASVLLPPLCPLCAAPVPGIHPSFCPNCRDDLRPLGEPFCSICAVPFAGAGPPHPCPSCRKDPPPFEELRAWGRYEGSLLRAIHALKYQRRFSLRKALQGLACEAFVRFWGEGPVFAAVTSVPPHQATLRKRGFDLPALLARRVAKEAGVPWRPAALAKIRQTPDLVGLGSKERPAAVAGAYAPREPLSGRVLLLDDVSTSTATSRQCAAACLAAGAEVVSVLVLARTPLEVR